jgi:choline dehydrogenase-like flavoprotein
MIVDAHNAPVHARLDCDVCIVGGGAAGISLATELADSGLQICILESGGLSYEAATQDLLKGEALGNDYPDLHETRLAALGGSTGLWAGWCRPLDPIDFEARDWVPGSGWPFSLSDLMPFYRRAQELCGLGPLDYDASVWARRTDSVPLPLPPDQFSTAIFQISPVSFGAHYRELLDRKADIRTVLHATVLRLFAASTADRIERARVATLDNKQFDVTARIFVLAAGGIENPRLLLLSGDSPELSIGNRRGLVGRYFMEHIFINAGSYLCSDVAQSMSFHFPTHAQLDGHDVVARSGFSVTPAIARSQRLLNGAIFFHPAYESHDVFDSPEIRALLEIRDKLRGRAVPGGYLKRAMRILRSPGKLAIAVSRRAFVRERRQRRWRTRALFECAAHGDNRVSLCSERDRLNRPRVRLRWQLTKLDLYSVRQTHALLDKALRAAGLGQFECRFPTDLSWQQAAEPAKHHLGTTRMHSEPAYGVVDGDCKVHGVPNLYIAGGSVFPTGGFANPTLTIVALAVRLAAHIRNQLASKT